VNIDTNTKEKQRRRTRKRAHGQERQKDKQKERLKERESDGHNETKAQGSTTTILTEQKLTIRSICRSIHVTKDRNHRSEVRLVPRTVVGQRADNAENASGVVTLLTVHGSTISTNPPSCKPLFNFRLCKSVCRAHYVLIVTTNCALITDWREIEQDSSS